MRAAIDARHRDEVARLERTEFDGAPSLWAAIRSEAERLAAEEPILGSFFHAAILNHEDLGAALSFHLANKLDSVVLPAMLIREVVHEAMASDPLILKAAEIDIIATRTRDPACDHFATPFLYYKGFHALQAYRVAHWLWQQDRRPLATFLQNQVSASLGVDIHPAATIGSGIMLDHATGIVIGETSVVDDDVSILHSVTLGGTGKVSGDRHPKIRHGVLLSAGAKIIGNIVVGEGAKVGAGSVVLEDVPPHVTVAGVPARIVGRPACESPALDMNQSLES
jgi:serine O-acetyltransferase